MKNKEFYQSEIAELMNTCKLIDSLFLGFEAMT